MMKHTIMITRRDGEDMRIFSSPYIRKCINTALACEGVDVPCEVSVLITDDEEIHEINLAQRNVDRATDVLSFPQQNLIAENFSTHGCDFNPETGKMPLGDIVISKDHILAQAREFGHSQRRELSYLLVHSVMHLLGYDHMDEGEMKKQMRRHEDAVMTILKR